MQAWPFIVAYYTAREPVFRPWDAPAYREIQRKIGKELRKHLELPKELPHQLFKVLMQFNDQSGE